MVYLWKRSSNGQRVICAHWKRVICAHCKRVTRAQRNRVIRAQRAVIRAHWCWEPAISGLVGGGGGVLKGPTFTYAEIFKVTYAENYPHTFSTSLAPKNLWLPVNFHEIALPRNAKNDPQSKINLSLSCSTGVGWVGGVGGGGVGWDDNVHVPMHTQAQQPHHLSCCWEETGTALSWSVTGGVGWVNKVHVPMPAHAQQPHHLSCCRALTRTALSWSVTWLMRWEELCEMSCVSCEMSGNTWDELCELWDEWSSVRWVVWVVRWVVWKNLGEVQWENTKQLHQMPHESSSWESWVVWDELSEMSCVRWVVWLVRWEELCEMKCVHCVRQLEWSWERKKQLRRRRRRRQGIQT